MTAPEGTVTWRQDGVAAIVTVDRPATRNAMSWAMYDQLAAALDEIAVAPGVRVAVLRGGGGRFIAGTDIAQFAEFATGEDGVAYERRLDAVVARFDVLPMPTIAVVEGDAMGGGLMLAAACDLRLCTTKARFGMPIARTVGNCLSMANYARLVMLLGPARVMQLVATAEAMRSSEAVARGFVIDAIDPSSLEARVSALTLHVASMAPITLQVTREAIRRIVRAVTTEGDDLIRQAYGSRDFHEGVAAFVAKRAPQWEGK